VTKEIIDYLSELIALPSISAFNTNRSFSIQTANKISEKLRLIGAEVKIVDNVIPGKNPIILAKLGDDPTKKTILFYSHYDVQPAAKEDGWDYDPFDLKELDGYVYGRGVSDDKGPLVATYFAVKELIDEGKLNVNVCFVYEGEEESSSGGFEDTLEMHKDFYNDIDGIMILDTSWFGEETPSMDYGFRGVTYMGIQIQGPNKDQHSGLVGGVIREPMEDLIYLMSKLKQFDGKVLINGFYDKVLPLTDEEKELYSNIEFDLEEFKKYLGRNTLLSEDTTTMLMNNWRNPTLSLHGIQGAFSEDGSKTVVPGKVIGKVSMRLVPNQDPKEIAQLFIDHITNEFNKINSPNKLDILTIGTGDWWYGDVNNFLFSAGKEAINEYWQIEPAFTRSGGSIPIIPFMEKLFDAPAMGLGIGQSTDGAHSQNERLRIKNLIGGKEVIKKILSKL